MDGGSLGKEGLKVALLADLFLQPRLVVARQPADDAVDLVFGAILALCLLDIERIDLGEGCGEMRCLGTFIPPRAIGSK
jgi:hypothetical protein